MTVAQGGATSFLVRFHGVRGSHPVSSGAVAAFGGNTSCVEVESGEFRVVFDCGTGMIPLGRMLPVPEDGRVACAVLVSHVHHDHTMGFPFFAPVYNPKARLFLAGPGHAGRGFQEVFEAAFADPYFPVAAKDMASQRTYRTVGHGDVLAWTSAAALPEVVSGPAPAGALVIRAFLNRNHPNGGVLNFRLERGERSVVLATDVEGTEGEEGDLVDFARGADLLLHDAQYTDEEYENTTRGWGHSTWRMAADVATRARVGRLVLYHHDPAHDDTAVEELERKAREKFPRSVSACEGLEIRV